jgi:hypothetical protein
MLFNLLGVVIVGVAAGGSVLLLRRLIGRRPAGWMVPAAAGSAMLAFHLWNEYSWFQRTADALPEHVAIARRYDYQSVLQPWTLLFPRINRFAAVDRASIRKNDKAPGYVMADVHLVTRLDRTARLTQIYDCPGRRRTDVDASSTVDAKGLPVDAAWMASEADAPFFRLVCGSS